MKNLKSSFCLFMAIQLILLIGDIQAAVYEVNTTASDGGGSLRQALTDANTHLGPDSIVFNIPEADAGFDGTVWTIQPAEQFPAIEDDGTIICGGTQGLYIRDTNPDGPEILLDGRLAEDADGFDIRSNHNEISGLIISGFEFDGINIIYDADYNWIWGNYIGTDATGTDSLGNGIFGVHILDNCDYNLIGGVEASHRNLISGNKNCGISINGSNNTISGNYVGTDRSGSLPLPNKGLAGVKINDGRSNIIGPANLISGNSGHGIEFSKADSNEVKGNKIGTNVDGTLALPNEVAGISISQSRHCQIGGPDEGEENLISGNGWVGIDLYGEKCRYNTIQRNLVGTNADARQALMNESSGIRIFRASQNLIGGKTSDLGNVISGNKVFGISLTGADTDSNLVRGNKIGTNQTEDVKIPNGYDGIRINENAKNNMIGPNNTIAYNINSGVFISGEDSRYNAIRENSIYSNTDKGIELYGSTNQNVQAPVITEKGSVGGTSFANARIDIFSDSTDEGRIYEGSTTADADGNFFWGGEAEGPFVTATATTDSGSTSEFSEPFRYKTEPIVVTNTKDDGNGSLRNAITLANTYAGPDEIQFNIPESDEGFDGTVWIIQLLSELPEIEDDYTTIDGCSQTENQGDTNPDGPEIFLNGQLAGNANGIEIESSYNEISGLVISGFKYDGIDIGFNCCYNWIWGNYIGTDITGSDSLSNHEYGIDLNEESNQNQIGGESDIHSNVISGNRASGIHLSRCSLNSIINNRIGTDKDGTKAIMNHEDGIYVYRSNQNQLGPGNIISGNGDDGIYISTSDSNRVSGNLIGTDKIGSTAIPNLQEGIHLNNTNYTQIGRTESLDGNLISGNKSSGIYVAGQNSRYNNIQGNIIGTNSDATEVMPNESNGIYISGAKQTLIGGDADNANIISGNLAYGIYLRNAGTDSNTVSHNIVGTNFSGVANLPNGDDGIGILYGASYNQLGPGNTLAFNADNGIYISGGDSKFNTITKNAIYNNADKGIELYGSTNQAVDAPEITGTGSILGTSFPEAIVEIFSDSTDEGRIYEGTCTADADGNFIWNGNPRGPFVTATATNDSGSTSEFSESFGYTYEPLIVTNTNDEGEGSLRWAIEQANENFGPDTIKFNIQEGDAGFDGTVWIIRPQSDLPAIVDDFTIIDGFSQRENQSDTNPDGPEIVLSGEDVDRGTGFVLQNNDNVIAGMIISGFDGHGILVYGDREKIVGNYIGTTAAGNDTCPNSSGIYLHYSNKNIIGSAMPGMGNVVSGNWNNGLNITHSDSNLIIGNKIGTDPSGTQALGNHMMGIYMEYSNWNRIGGISKQERNIIAGNGQDGIRMKYGSSDNQILGNYIGADSSGTAAVPNEWRGMSIYSQRCARNIIGGLEEGAGNIISGNNWQGIYLADNADSTQIVGNYIGTDCTGLIALPNDYGVLLGSKATNTQIGPRNIISGNNYDGIEIHSRDSEYNHIIGNWIGLNATGQDTLPNGQYGIVLHGNTKYNHIGGETTKEKNVISGNKAEGIYIYGDSTTFNLVLNNFIGTDTSGTLSLGNGRSGIEIKSPDNVVGPDNLICHNTLHGIELTDTLAQRITITGNSIYNNSRTGISMFEGTNNNIQPPEIATTHPFSGIALPNSTVEIFSDSTDEGRIYETSVTSDGDGIFTWDGSPTGPFVTATVTDAEGNTSTFSQAVNIDASPVEEMERCKIKEFAMHQNHPNPFNPQTTIAYDLIETADVTLIIYNLIGREVWQNQVGIQNAGQHQLVWYGQNQQGSQVATGIYFYQIRMTEPVSGNLLYQNIRKMIFMK